MAPLKLLALNKYISGHTCTMINKSLFCVLGREGGLKIQRKFGDIFLLHINLDQSKGVMQN